MRQKMHRVEQRVDLAVATEGKSLICVHVATKSGMR
jgi:hypothetical protein